MKQKILTDPEVEAEVEREPSVILVTIPNTVVVQITYERPKDQMVKAASHLEVESVSYQYLFKIFH